LHKEQFTSPLERTPLEASPSLQAIISSATFQASIETLDSMLGIQKPLKKSSTVVGLATS
jgi:hypothetical protein